MNFGSAHMSNVAPNQTQQEFHRRRAEVEMDRALAAKEPSTAILHLELARRHREVRNRMSLEARASLRVIPSGVFGTDKEA